jgi:signal transduction histidine kinase
VDSMLQRALQGMPTEVHSFTYDLSRNPHAEAVEAGELVLFLTLRPLFDDSGELIAVVCLIADYASGRARYEQDLMRSQKMENIERLASGIAHEFNNLFTGIKGMTELIKDEVPKSSEIYEFADSIQQNIARGAELIQQLSSFARDVPITLRRVRLSKYLEQSMPLLQMHVQKRISIETRLHSDGEVLLDASRMDQALANIMVNARDAMTGQGRVLITVDRKAPHPDLSADLPEHLEWIMLEVADSGPGIPVGLHQRVLEPFFTTKERGKATGLGLSVTARIVTSHNGLIQIGESEQLGGAAIRIYLPLGGAA